MSLSNELVLWRIPVQNQRRKLWPVSSADKCTVDLEFFCKGKSIIQSEGRWDSDDGPIEQQHLPPDGRIRFVPIVIQSFVPAEFSPRMLRHTTAILEPGVVHVMGIDFLIGGKNLQRIDVGQYELEVSVKCEGKKLTARCYTLHVPHPKTGHVILKMASSKRCQVAK